MPAGLARTTAVAALLTATVALTACGSSDDTSSTTTQAAAATTSDASFCTDFAKVSKDIGIEIDPTASDAAAKLTDAADALKAVQPPAQLADDWNTLVTFYTEFGTAFANMDGGSLDKVGEAITKLQKAAPQLTSAAKNIAQYASDNC
jgi:hypothetical protein